MIFEVFTFIWILGWLVASIKWNANAPLNILNVMLVAGVPTLVYFGEEIITKLVN